MTSAHGQTRSEGWGRVVLLLLLGVMAMPGTAADSRRNFVFFLVDDLGWRDVGAFGSTFYETPNIDALAATGTRFTQAYAACPVCSPTRASILTGRHPVRVNITDWIPGMRAARVSNPRFLHVDDASEMALADCGARQRRHSRVRCGPLVRARRANKRAIVTAGSRYAQTDGAFTQANDRAAEADTAADVSRGCSC